MTGLLLLACACAANEKNTFDGTVEVLMHEVSFTYFDIEAPITQELTELLTEEAENRAEQMIQEGYNQGELNCYYDGEKEYEIRGWWAIKHPQD